MHFQYSNDATENWPATHQHRVLTIYRDYPRSIVVDAFAVSEFNCFWRAFSITFAYLFLIYWKQITGWLKFNMFFLDSPTQFNYVLIYLLFNESVRYSESPTFHSDHLVLKPRIFQLLLISIECEKYLTSSKPLCCMALSRLQAIIKYIFIM